MVSALIYPNMNLLFLKFHFSITASIVKVYYHYMNESDTSTVVDYPLPESMDKLRRFKVIIIFYKRSLSICPEPRWMDNPTDIK